MLYNSLSIHIATSDVKINIKNCLDPPEFTANITEKNHCTLKCKHKYCTKKWHFPLSISPVLRIWSHLLENCLKENVIFCAVLMLAFYIIVDFFSVMFVVNSGGPKQFLILSIISDIAISINSELCSILFWDLKTAFILQKIILYIAYIVIVNLKSVSE